MKFKSVQYAGHSAVLVNMINDQGESLTLGIDPWLEGNPLCPENLKNPPNLDIIVLSHGHADHAGDTVRLAKKYGSKVFATYELAMILIGEGLIESNVYPMNKGGTAQYQDISITLTHALHSSSYDTASGPVYAGEACGVVVNDGHNTIYHAGDTCLFKDLKQIGKRYSPDIAFLPIGDRFTMGPIEAADAASLIKPKLAIPIHYKTFPQLTGTYSEFAKACHEHEIQTTELAPGQEITVPQNRHK